MGMQNVDNWRGAQGDCRSYVRCRCVWAHCELIRVAMQILQWGTFAVGPWRCLAAGRLSGAFYWLARGFVLLGWLSGAFHRSARGFAMLRVVSVR